MVCYRAHLIQLAFDHSVDWQRSNRKGKGTSNAYSTSVWSSWSSISPETTPITGCDCIACYRRHWAHVSDDSNVIFVGSRPPRKFPEVPSRRYPESSASQPPPGKLTWPAWCLSSAERCVSKSDKPARISLDDGNKHSRGLQGHRSVAALADSATHRCPVGKTTSVGSTGHASLMSDAP